MHLFYFSSQPAKRLYSFELYSFPKIIVDTVDM
jgi:hypothetical protein